jgi:hypothetical protein
MTYKIIYCLIFFISIGQAEKTPCSTVKNGTFYFYPRNSENKYLIIRKQGLQQEIKVGLSDTSFWKVNWLDDCRYTEKFVRRTKPLSDAEKKYIYNVTVTTEILKVTRNYYTFRSGIDSLTGKDYLTDTVWIKLRK